MICVLSFLLALDLCCVPTGSKMSNSDNCFKNFQTKQLKGPFSTILKLTYSLLLILLLLWDLLNISTIRTVSFRDLNKICFNFHSYPSTVLQLKKRTLLYVVRHAKACYHQAQQYILVNTLGM